ncbi:TIGR04290 family methyltransferase [Martelella sp.]|uniref:TIGR04290 family methyltransferase n=1 Tax=Martelella sp. TaxID=1969699 RepID=UPI0032421AF7
MTAPTRHGADADIAALGPWFHNLRINGSETAPDHFLGDFPSNKWAGFSHVLPDDLQGCSVLDIGCNAGFYSLEMKRRNAGRVLGIDCDERYLAQARFAAAEFDVDIEYRQMSVYDLRQLDETFDLVLFMGVFYHLRHPLLALDLLHETVVGERMLFQSLQRGATQTAELAENYPFDEQALFDRPDFPKLHFVEQRYADDPTNWFIPNRAAVEAMLRSAGFAILENPEPEVFLVERGERYFAADPAPHTGQA